MRFNSSLFDIPFVNNVLYYDTIASTNDMAKELARRGSVHGTLVIAESQTAGKGRLGRSFESQTKEGLYFSLMLRPEVSPEHLSRITLVSALAVSRAIDEVCTVKTSIKWPNDIYLGDKKLVGILTEAGPNYVVIGIGINVNTRNFSPELSGYATSLLLETGYEVDKALLLATVLYKLNSLYDKFIYNNDLSYMVNDYNNKLGCLGKEVYIIPQQRSLSCSNASSIDTTDLTPHTCLGIDCEGNLICKNPIDELLYVNSGEVSLRQL